MIGFLKGRLVDTESPGKIVLDVNGVGYDVETSLNTFFALTTMPAEIALHIHTIVREDALLLYGFGDKEERNLFRTLIKVNGVGPKLAMAILSSLSPSEFIEAIQSQDLVKLTRLPGIGKKTAERLLVLLKDSFDDVVVSLKGSSSSLNAQTEALEALIGLGFKPKEAENALKAIDDEVKETSELIRHALRRLSSAK